MPKSIEEQVEPEVESTEEVEEQVVEQEAAIEEEVEESSEPQEQEEGSEDESLEEIYEVDVPDGSGGYVTETVNINDLPGILSGAKKLQMRERELAEQQQQLSNYSALLNFVTTDNLTKSIAQYRLQGVSEFEAIEAVYNYYLTNGAVSSSSSQDELVDPTIKELRDKVKRYDQFFENQERTRNIEENNKFLAQEAINLGYQIDEQDLPTVIDTANQVAFQLFSEIAPDIPAEQFTAQRKITPAIARAIWDETSRRLQGKLGAMQEQSNKTAVRRYAGSKKVQAPTQKPKSTPPKVISGKRGSDVTSNKATKSAPFVPKGSTNRDRAQALKALFGSSD